MPPSSSNSLKPTSSAGPSQAHGARLFKLPVELPSLIDGLMALLVTDLEGFTHLVESLGDVEARSVIQQHNRLLRTCVRHHHGQEVAHTGDGLIVAFRAVSAALLCARDMQAALSEHSRVDQRTPLHARIGVHAGEPLPEEDRLFGHCVNVAVRVCGEAQAGRVLVTDVVRQLAQGRFAFGGGAVHELKGMSLPVNLYEFTWQGS